MGCPPPMGSPAATLAARGDEDADKAEEALMVSEPLPTDLPPGSGGLDGVADESLRSDPVADEAAPPPPPPGRRTPPKGAEVAEVALLRAAAAAATRPSLGLLMEAEEGPCLAVDIFALLTVLEVLTVRPAVLMSDADGISSPWGEEVGRGNPASVRP